MKIKCEDIQKVSLGIKKNPIVNSSKNRKLISNKKYNSDFAPDDLNDKAYSDKNTMFIELYNMKTNEVKIENQNYMIKINFNVEKNFN